MCRVMEIRGGIASVEGAIRARVVDCVVESWNKCYEVVGLVGEFICPVCLAVRMVVVETPAGEVIVFHPFVGEGEMAESSRWVVASEIDHDGRIVYIDRIAQLLPMWNCLFLLI